MTGSSHLICLSTCLFTCLFICLSTSSSTCLSLHHQTTNQRQTSDLRHKDLWSLCYFSGCLRPRRWSSCIFLCLCLFQGHTEVSVKLVLVIRLVSAVLIHMDLHCGIRVTVDPLHCDILRQVSRTDSTPSSTSTRETERTTNRFVDLFCSLHFRGRTSSYNVQKELRVYWRAVLLETSHS